MAYNSKDNYPRPDFVHGNHRWTPINDGWSILFDDEDVGLREQWHIAGVPDKVSVKPTATDAEAEALAQRLAAFPELKEKGFQAPRDRTYEKRPINVPFTFQTKASDIDDNDAHEVLWYERTVADPRSDAERGAGDRVLLRFGAVDYDVTVWAAGYPVAAHRGGHVPFEVDISDALARAAAAQSTEFLLVLRIRDSPHDLAQPRGKQYWAPQPESIFYHPSSGIWQPVWLEVVPPTRVGDSSAGTVLRANNIKEGLLEARVSVLGRRAGHAYAVEIEGSLHGVKVASKQENVPADKDYVFVNLGLELSDEQKSGAPPSLAECAPYYDTHSWRGNLALWSPEHPTLYDISIRLYDGEGALLDEVTTYTGFRHLDWNKGDRTFRLNGWPLFQALVLDQGYWPETGLTPPSPESLKKDIEISKRMGFNGCRKHQKVEDPVFLYWADKLGYLVWGEMANAYEFNEDYAERFSQEWLEAVKRDINHPSIVTWTPVNVCLQISCFSPAFTLFPLSNSDDESWAYPDLKGNVEQRNHIRSLYYLTKTLDPTRPINDNCGWEHVITDLSTFHDYSDAPELAKTCSTLEGILGKKLGDRDFFVGPTTLPDGRKDKGTKHREGAPVICSEFGGVNIAPAKRDEGGERDWGYTTASDPRDLLKRFDRLLRAVVEPGHICGVVYTQLSDVEQEVNGLYSFDRREKIPATEVSKIVEEVIKVYYDSLPKD
ncbi:glycoside hydrolase family 2 protein [Annulohypoxylon truncatum]|uniref:glycoside hydrolase family 2 protein n=1 Tax=Annulohypoxylon truncatum TaxID=327061 RepID=UPI0020081AC7|nr:glycoside hydrolase family 2 protein [Annulohypoxylon truncatum]KAI1208970.1 glycoside hydrolase family 2 protein [Annulohypoxylon truncatum]